MAIEGVDYAWSGPSPAALAAAGKKFACRYGGPGSDGKQLHADELAALQAAGIDVVANAEGSAAGFKGTAAGESWATQARDHFGGLGMPAGRPIYFSIDWDAGSGDWAAIDAALAGAASVIGAAQVGVYGSYDTMAHCRAAGSARWFWQTYAWSGGRAPASYVHLYQYRNGVTIGGADCDLTRALLPDYGQWGITEEDGMAYINNRNDLIAEMRAVFADPAVRSNMAYGILGYDPDATSDGALAWPAVGDPWHPGQSMAPGSAIGAILTILLSKNDPADTAGPVNRIAEIKQMIQTLAVSLNPDALATAIAAKLPAGSAPTQDQLEAALSKVFRDAFTS